MTQQVLVHSTVTSTTVHNAHDYTFYQCNEDKVDYWWANVETDKFEEVRQQGYDEGWLTLITL